MSTAPDRRILQESLHVVVCARNNRDIIGETLEHLDRQSHREFTCTLVDGCSTDGTPEFVRERFPWVDVLVKTEDSGPAASRNLGARRSDATCIVFLDSDVRLESDWIAQQASFLEADRTVGIVCGALVSAEAPHVLQATYGAMNRYAVAWDAGGGESPERFAAPRFCLWAISAAMMVRRDVFDAIGGFDERLFAFHEDSDLGWRANLAGRRVAYNPRARARHQEHSTMNSSTMSGRITYLLFRNRIRSALVNYEWHNAARYLPVHVTLALLDGVARPPRMAKLRAIAWNLSNLGDTLRRRQITQRVRRVRDRDLWPLFEPGLRGPGRVLW